MRPPGRKHARNISKKQAGDDRFAVGADDRRERRREQPQGLRQNVGEDEIVRRALAQARALSTPRETIARQKAPTPFSRALALATSTATGSMSPSQTLRRRTLAAAMASTPAPQPTSSTRLGPAALEQAVEMQEAAAGRAVMAGAEGEPGLDLDRDVVRPDPRAVVGAVNEKAPGAHGLQAGERIGDPVALLRQAKGRGAGGRFVRGGGDQRPDRLFVRRRAEIGLHEPGLAAARPRLVGLERGRRRLGRLEALDDEIGDGAGAALVADEAHMWAALLGGRPSSMA